MPPNTPVFVDLNIYISTWIFMGSYTGDRNPFHSGTIKRSLEKRENILPCIHTFLR